ncbi:ogr/Delta-like zinc finger family protein [Pseudoxanthomonas wuyuanensis]|uniref:ogr/Delta-like zinc finger family protein n=1 Tax=Pseudoxanthomonas wuyuanensis TaxID=1073196 RepID=UPI001389772B|nr:ogr/Delta-like zinc finger family protein [Pseudoxanthomonas wuyuanensis]KAF1719788.1 hypothetical protein CSC75_13960 [Pseudoxanthomonas wuyuanensis]
MAVFSPRRKVVFSCPACGAHLIKRTSYLLHQFLRHDTFVCDNPVCSAAFSGHTELTHLASPSGMPHAPPCELPRTPGSRRDKTLEKYRDDDLAARKSAQTEMTLSLAVNADNNNGGDLDDDDVEEPVADDHDD